MQDDLGQHPFFCQMFARTELLLPAGDPDAARQPVSPKSSPANAESQELLRYHPDPGGAMTSHEHLQHDPNPNGGLSGHCPV